MSALVSRGEVEAAWFGGEQSAGRVHDRFNFVVLDDPSAEEDAPHVHVVRNVRTADAGQRLAVLAE